MEPEGEHLWPVAVAATAVACDTQFLQQIVVPKRLAALLLKSLEGGSPIASFVGWCRTEGRREPLLGDEQLPPL